MRIRRLLKIQLAWCRCGPGTNIEDYVDMLCYYFPHCCCSSCCCYCWFLYYIAKCKTMERHEIMYTRQQSTRTSNYKSDDNYNCVQRKLQTIRQQVKTKDTTQRYLVPLEAVSKVYECYQFCTLVHPFVRCAGYTSILHQSHAQISFLFDC